VASVHGGHGQGAAADFLGVRARGTMRPAPFKAVRTRPCGALVPAPCPAAVRRRLLEAEHRRPAKPAAGSLADAPARGVPVASRRVHGNRNDEPKR
jgi:hypothetical protein